MILPYQILLIYFRVFLVNVNFLMDYFCLLILTGFLRKAVTFEEQFEFHFYDLDFYRQCIRKELKLVVWPIAVRHTSAGEFESVEWISAKEKYLPKWR